MPRPGQDHIVNNVENIKRLNNVIGVDRTSELLFPVGGIKYGCNNISYNCMVSWISKGMFPLGPIFTDIPKEYGMLILQELLQWYQMEGNEFLWHNVVVDEMWHNPQPTKKSVCM